MKPRRILLLIPHPDDEVVGCAVALRRAVAAGAQVFGLYLTTGVPPREALWPWQRPGHGRQVARRRGEAERVGAALRLTPVGFQDWPSRSLKSHIPAALQLIAEALDRHAIEALWVPAWEGGHQDHDVANVLGAQFAAHCPVTEFAEYNLSGGKTRFGSFVELNGTEEILSLSPEEAAWKRGLLAIYRSERGNLAPIVAHIMLRTEALRPLPAHDYGRRPHEGRLFYERFQWVPLRHPRIDFDPPETVYGALAGLVRKPDTGIGRS